MKGRTIGTKLTGLGLALALVLTGCGDSGNDSPAASGGNDSALTGGSAQESNSQAGGTTQQDAEASGSANSEIDALVEELLTRNVTADDRITEEVIAAAIAKLKETYTFESLKELKIASGDWVYIGQDKGWFDQLFGDNGTAVEAVEGTIGNEVQLMERGDLHLTNRMLYPFLLYRAQGANITAVALSADPAPEIVTILVRADSDINSFEELQGKKIGSWNAGCQYVALLELAQDLGWEEGVDYTYVNMADSDFQPALQAGEVDAISTHPTIGSLSNEILTGNFREIANAKTDGVYTNYGGASVTFAYTEFAESYPNILGATLKLRELINAYIIQNQEEAAETIEGITRTPAANTIFGFERRKETYYNSQESFDEIVADTGAYQDWLIENTAAFSEEDRVDPAGFYDHTYFVN